MNVENEDLQGASVGNGTESAYAKPTGDDLSDEIKNGEQETVTLVNEKNLATNTNTNNINTNTNAMCDDDNATPPVGDSSHNNNNSNSNNSENSAAQIVTTKMDSSRDDQVGALTHKTLPMNVSVNSESDSVVLRSNKFESSTSAHNQSPLQKQSSQNDDGLNSHVMDVDVNTTNTVSAHTSLDSTMVMSVSTLTAHAAQVLSDNHTSTQHSDLSSQVVDTSVSHSQTLPSITNVNTSTSSDQHQQTTSASTTVTIVDNTNTAHSATANHDIDIDKPQPTFLLSVPQTETTKPLATQSTTPLPPPTIHQPKPSSSSKRSLANHPLADLAPYIIASDTTVESARNRLYTALEQTRILREAFTERVYDKYRVVLRPVPKTCNDRIRQLNSNPMEFYKVLNRQVRLFKDEKELEKKEAHVINTEIAGGIMPPILSDIAPIENADQLSWFNAGLSLVILPEEQVDQMELMHRGIRHRGPIDPETGHKVAGISSAAATAASVLLERVRKGHDIRMSRKRKLDETLSAGTDDDDLHDFKLSKINFDETAEDAFSLSSLPLAHNEQSPAMSGTPMSLFSNVNKLDSMTTTATNKSKRSKAGRNQGLHSPNSPKNKVKALTSLANLLSFSPSNEGSGPNGKLSAAALVLRSHGVGNSLLKSNSKLATSTPRWSHPFPQSKGARKMSSISTNLASSKKNTSLSPNVQNDLFLPKLPSVKERLSNTSFEIIQDDTCDDDTKTAVLQILEQFRISPLTLTKPLNLSNNLDSQPNEAFSSCSDDKHLTKRVTELALMKNLHYSTKPSDSQINYNNQSDEKQSEVNTTETHMQTESNKVDPFLALSVLHGLGLVVESSNISNNDTAVSESLSSNLNILDCGSYFHHGSMSDDCKEEETTENKVFQTRRLEISRERMSELITPPSVCRKSPIAEQNEIAEANDHEHNQKVVTEPVVDDGIYVMNKLEIPILSLRGGGESDVNSCDQEEQKLTETNSNPNRSSDKTTGPVARKPDLPSSSSSTSPMRSTSNSSQISSTTTQQGVTIPRTSTPISSNSIPAIHLPRHQYLNQNHDVLQAVLWSEQSRNMALHGQTPTLMSHVTPSLDSAYALMAAQAAMRPASVPPNLFSSQANRASQEVVNASLSNGHLQNQQDIYRHFHQHNASSPINSHQLNASQNHIQNAAAALHTVPFFHTPNVDLSEYFRNNVHGSPAHQGFNPAHPFDWQTIVPSHPLISPHAPLTSIGLSPQQAALVNLSVRDRAAIALREQQLKAQATAAQNASMKLGETNTSSLIQRTDSGVVSSKSPLRYSTILSNPQTAVTKDSRGNTEENQKTSSTPAPTTNGNKSDKESKQISESGISTVPIGKSNTTTSSKNTSEVEGITSESKKVEANNKQKQSKVNVDTTTVHNDHANVSKLSEPSLSMIQTKEKSTTEIITQLGINDSVLTESIAHDDSTLQMPVDGKMEETKKKPSGSNMSKDSCVKNKGLDTNRSRSNSITKKSLSHDKRDETTKEKNSAKLNITPTTLDSGTEHTVNSKSNDSCDIISKTQSAQVDENGTDVSVSKISESKNTIIRPEVTSLPQASPCHVGMRFFVPTRPSLISEVDANRILSAHIDQAILPSTDQMIISTSCFPDESKNQSMLEYLITVGNSVPVPKALVSNPLKERLHSPVCKSVFNRLGCNNISVSTLRDAISAVIATYLWVNHQESFEKAFAKSGRIDVDPLCKWLINSSIQVSVQALESGTFWENVKIDFDKQSTADGNLNASQVTIIVLIIVVLVSRSLNRSLRISEEMDAMLPNLDALVKHLDQLRLCSLRTKCQERALVASLVSRRSRMSESFSHAYTSSMIRAGEVLGYDDLCDTVQDETSMVSTLLPFDILSDSTGAWEDPCRPSLGFTPGLGSDELSRKAHARAAIQKSLRKLQDRHNIKGGTPNTGPYIDQISGDSVVVAAGTASSPKNPSSLTRSSSSIKRKNSFGNSLSENSSGFTPAMFSLFNPNHYSSPFIWDNDDIENSPYGSHDNSRKSLLGVDSIGPVGKRPRLSSPMSSSKNEKNLSFDSYNTKLIRSTHEIEWSNVADMFQVVSTGLENEKGVTTGSTSNSTTEIADSVVAISSSSFGPTTIFAPFCRKVGDIQTQTTDSKDGIGNSVPSESEEDSEEEEEEMSDEQYLSNHQQVLDEMKEKFDAMMSIRQKYYERTRSRSRIEDTKKSSSSK